MKPCPHEERVRRIKSAGQREEDLEDHLASCASCREVALVSRFMDEMREETVRLPHRLPDPGLLWWKSKLIQKWDREARAVRPVVLMSTVTQILGILLPAVVVVWMGRQAVDSLSRIVADFPLSLLGEGTAGALNAVGLSAVFIAATLLITLRLFLLED